MPAPLEKTKTAPLEKTKTPGIYKRGKRYVVRYRVNGKPQWETFRTLDEARAAKAARKADADRGEFQERSRITLHEHSRAWIDTYQGRSGGLREETREDYRRQLNTYVLRFFGPACGLPR